MRFFLILPFPTLYKQWISRLLLQIILSQEKNIQRLNELLQNLQQQLLQCRGSNNTVNGTGNSLAANVNEIERQQIVED